MTFVYAESVAVVGPLSHSDEPHSWDLCEQHAARITVPRGWEMMRSSGGYSVPRGDEDDLTALAEAVREGAVRRSSVSVPNTAAAPAELHHPAPPRPGRRGHLRILPEPVD